MHNSDNVKVTLNDGVERELRYSLGTVRRLRKSLGGEIATLMDRPSDEVLPALIYEGLVDRVGLDVDKVAELIDIHSVNDVTAAFLEAFTGRKPVAKNEQTSLAPEAIETPIAA